MDLSSRLTSPLFLGGLTMMAGHGPGAGISAGTQMQNQRLRHQAHADAMADRRQKAERFQQLLTPGVLKNITPQQRQMAQFLGPEKGALMLTQLMKPKAPTAMERNFRLAQSNPEFAQFLDRRRPTTNVNIGGEKAFVTERSKEIAKKIGALEAQTDAARDIAQGFGQIGDLVNEEGVYTGTAAELAAWAKKTGQTMFGMDLEGVGPTEAVLKVQKSLVGKIREMAGDARMSDADRKFYMETIPGLPDSAEGIAITVEAAKHLADQKTAQEAKAHEFLDGAPNARAGWQNFRAWRSKQPLTSPELIQRARAAAKTAKQRRPTAGTPLDAYKDRYGLE